MQSFGVYEVDAEGRRCYRPPVPPVPALNEVWSQYESCLKALEAFDRAIDAFPVPNVTGRLFARLDAVHSSGAEGATTTFTDLMEYQCGQRPHSDNLAGSARRQINEVAGSTRGLKRARDPQDAQSVAACAEAFDDLSSDRAHPSTMAQHIHHRLFERARDPYVQARAGRWKDHPNSTTDPDFGGPFHYTHPSSLPAALKEWETFTKGDGNEVAVDRESPEVLRQVLSHWMFEHIHPFVDGNGRVGRLLVPLMLKHAGVTRNACAFLGESVHLDKPTYIDALKDGRRSGDMGLWTRTCLSLIRQTAQANLRRLEALGRLMDDWRGRVAGIRRHSVVHELLPFVLTKPVFTVNDAVAAVGGTYPAVNAAVERLVGLGILRPKPAETGERAKRGRMFEAPEVMAIFEPVTPPRVIGLDQTPTTAIPFAVDPAGKAEASQLLTRRSAEELAALAVATKAAIAGPPPTKAKLLEFQTGLQLLGAEMGRRGIQDPTAYVSPATPNPPRSRTGGHER